MKPHPLPRQIEPAAPPQGAGAVSPATFTITREPAVALAATLYPALGPVVPKGKSGSGVPIVVGIGSATGVAQGYYARFARYIAERGASVLTFDYAGTGNSGPTGTARAAVRMRDWGERDITSVLAWLRARYPSASLRWVGHSYGGFGTGLSPVNGVLERQLTVACMSAHWRLIPGVERYKVLAQLGVGMPAISRVLGYFPGRLAGNTLDLPHGVVAEWSRWCLTPHFVFGDDTLASLANLHSFRADLRFTAFRDDPWCGPEAVEHLAGQFTRAASREIIWRGPADTGGRPIGHVGYFREHFRDTLWQEAVDWLLA